MTQVDVAHAAALEIMEAAKSGKSIKASLSGMNWGAVCGTSLLAHTRQVATESRYYLAMGHNVIGEAEVVDERAPKPEVIETTKDDLPLQKVGAWASATQEDLTFQDTAEHLIGACLLRSVAKAVDLLIVEAMVAKSIDIDLTGIPNPTGAIVAAQAQLLANGTCPDVLAVSPGVYALLLGESAASGYALIGSVTGPGAGSQGSLFGMQLIASNAIPEGQAYMYDSADVVTAYHAKTPQIWFNPMDTSNVSKLIADYNCAIAIGSPEGVAHLDFTVMAPNP